MIAELAMLKNFSGAVLPFLVGGWKGSTLSQTYVLENLVPYLDSVDHPRLESSHYGYKGDKIDDTPL